MSQPTFGIITLFMADHDHTDVAYTRQTADNRLIVGKCPIPGKCGKIVKHRCHIMFEMRSFGMACDLGLLPRRQFRIGIFQQLVSLGAELVNFRAYIDGTFKCCFLQIHDARLKCGNRLFKIEINCHKMRLEPVAAWVNAASCVLQADDVHLPAPQVCCCRHGCKFASSRCRHVPASLAMRANWRPQPANAWQRHGAAHAG